MLDELHDRDGLLDILVILMAVVMESDKVTAILINAGRGDDRPSKIAVNIFDNRFRDTGIGFGIIIEAIFMFQVATDLYFFKRG